jgi:prefoldin alpha subunit
MSTAVSVDEETKAKLEEYAHFVKATLRPNLQQALHSQHDIESQLHDFKELHKRLMEWETRATQDRTTTADLGHERVFCRARVTDPSAVFVDVGYGFHVELRIEEAMQFTLKRIAFLNEKLQYHQAAVQRIHNHMNSVEDILEQFQMEQLDDSNDA